MSQATAVRTAPRPVGRAVPRPVPAPPRLRVVSAPAHTRSRAGLVFACIGLLAVGLVGLLLLNVSLEHGSYVLQAQQARATQLSDQAQALREDLATLQAPQNLAAQATRLGMVPNPNAAFLRASDGKILGVPTRAVAPVTPTVSPTPAASPAPAPSAPAKPAASAPAKPATNPATNPAGAGAKKPTPKPTH
jgi:hypothetical protein